MVNVEVEIWSVHKREEKLVVLQAKNCEREEGNPKASWGEGTKGTVFVVDKRQQKDQVDSILVEPSGSD